MKLPILALVLIFSSCVVQNNDEKSSKNTSNTTTGDSITKKSLSPFVKNSKIMFGALVSEVANKDQVGFAMKIAIDLAVEDINKEFAAQGRKVTLQVEVRDSPLEPEKNYDAFSELTKSGEVRVLIGPDTSANLKSIVDNANKNGVVIISPAATTALLSKSDDTVCRLVPSDAYLGKALAQMMKDKKITNFVGLIRKDADGTDAYQYGKEATRRVGITSKNSITFSTADEADYTKDIESLAQFSDFDAVQLISFQEMVNIFSLASKNTKLASVPWFGSDGNAQMTDLLNSKEAAEFAIKVDFQAPAFAAPENKGAEFEAFVKRIRDKAGSQIPVDVFAVIAYDAVIQAARTSSQIDQKTDVKAWMSTFIENSRNATGITGPLRLNNDCDREGGDYAVWKVRAKSPASYEWFIARTIAVPSL